MTENPAPAVNAPPEVRPTDTQTVSIPLGMLYGCDLPQTVRFTWLQLYGLACRREDGRLQTPPLALKEIARITGKSISALYNQLAVLRSLRLVHQRSLKDGRIALFFGGDDAEALPASGPSPENQPANAGDAAAAWQIEPAAADALMRNQPAAFPVDRVESPAGVPEDPKTAKSVSKFRDSRFQETRISPSLKYLKDLNNPLLLVKEREDKFPNSSFQESGKAEAECSSRLSPIAVYHELTGLHLNKVQRKMLLDQVGEAQLWRECVAHWLGHRWNPFNIPGMLDLYRRGGPTECLLCKPGNNPGAQSDASPGETEPAADPIENLRRRHGLV